MRNATIGLPKFDYCNDDLNYSFRNNFNPRRKQSLQRASRVYVRETDMHDDGKCPI